MSMKSNNNKPPSKKTKTSKSASICRQLRELGATPFETDMKSWTKIGQGAFGVVYSNGYKALKVINLEAKNIKPDELMTEIEILKKISNHDCVVNMTKFYIDESCEHLYIEMELSTVGDMVDIINIFD